MNTPPLKEETPEVPVRVFEQFIQALVDSGVPSEVVARLRKTLLEEKTFTERALKDAVLAEEPLP